jgi:hypothetical protein
MHWVFQSENSLGKPVFNFRHNPVHDLAPFAAGYHEAGRRLVGVFSGSPGYRDFDGKEGHPLKGPLSREKPPLRQGKYRFLAEGTAVLRTAAVRACSSALPVFLTCGVGSFPHRTSHPSESRHGP